MAYRVSVNREKQEINPDAAAFFKLGKATAMFGQSAQSELDIYGRIPKKQREFLSNVYMTGYQSWKGFYD